MGLSIDRRRWQGWMTASPSDSRSESHLRSGPRFRACQAALSSSQISSGSSWRNLRPGSHTATPHQLFSHNTLLPPFRIPFVRVSSCCFETGQPKCLRRRTSPRRRSSAKASGRCLTPRRRLPSGILRTAIPPRRRYVSPSCRATDRRLRRHEPIALQLRTP